MGKMFDVLYVGCVQCNEGTVSSCCSIYCLRGSSSVTHRKEVNLRVFCVTTTHTFALLLAMTLPPSVSVLLFLKLLLFCF